MIESKKTLLRMAGMGSMVQLMDKGLCPLCSKVIGEFKDELSKKEYGISGMCQECQDKVFA